MTFLYLRYRQRTFYPSGAASYGVPGGNSLIALVLLLAAFGVLIESAAALLVLACTWDIIFPAIGFVLTFVVVARGTDGSA